MSYEHAHEQPIAADAGQQWAIDARGLSKHYEIYDRPSLRLRQFIWPRLQRWLQRPVRQYYRKFQALQEIDIQVRKGQTVGIIGRNGSGKSTLLQIICGTLHPSAGQVQVQGRVCWRWAPVLILSSRGVKMCISMPASWVKMNR